MKIYREYDRLLRECPLCGKYKARLIESKKRSGINRKYYPGYKVICFNCWTSTRSFFLIKDVIKMWNNRKYCLV